MKTRLLIAAFVFGLLPAAHAQTTGRTGVTNDAGPGADEGARVVLATGQDALDLLHPASPHDVALRRWYNDRAATFFAGASAAEPATVAHVFAPTGRARAAEDVLRMFALHRDAYGEMTAFAVVGSTPRPGGGTCTYVEAAFGARRVTFRMVWADRHLVTVYPASPASPLGYTAAHQRASGWR